MHIIESRAKRRVPLKHSLLFSKAKHSEEWHQAIDAIAGVLTPSDLKFPYPLLRQATDDYLKKKGKMTQADTNIRLAIIVESHAAKHIAVAAAAHAMTAGSLRAILHVNLNVSHGSYWGLEVWLQCLIAANYCNPASVTDLEAKWARHLLPLATHGPTAAGKILVGISRALQECATPNMNAVPDFLTLTSRAVADYGAYLEGLRLKNQWISAYAASCWMAELSRTSPASTPPGFLLPEHIFDTQFPIWRVWARWRPDLKFVHLLSSLDGFNTALLSDLLALEGPDFVSGTKSNLREGLIDQYTSSCGFVKLGQMLVEVPGRTRDGLREILECAVSTLGSIWTAAAPTLRSLLLNFFAEVTVIRPLTQQALNLVQAILFMTGGTSTSVGPSLIDAVLHVYTQRNELGGRHISELQDLIQLFSHDRASGLRRILLTPTVLEGIGRCIEESQAAICTLLREDEPWTELALELHMFGSTLKQSEHVPVLGLKVLEQMCLLLPSEESMRMSVDIYNAARYHNSTPPIHFFDQGQFNPSRDSIQVPVDVAERRLRNRNPIEEVVEQYVSHHLLSQQQPNYISQRTFNAILKIWESKFEKDITRSRRLLAILVANATHGNADLRIRCLNGIASTADQLGPGLSVHDLLKTLQAETGRIESKIVGLIRLLAKCSAADDLAAQLLCWRDFAYHLLVLTTHVGVARGVDLIEFTLSTMKAAEWLSFLSDVQSVFVAGPVLPSEDSDIPSILQPEVQRYRCELMRYTTALTRLENSLGQGSNALRSILGRSGPNRAPIFAILEVLRRAEQTSIEPFIHNIVGCLSTRSENSGDVSECASRIINAPPETVEVCKKIWDARHGFLMIPGLSGRSGGKGDISTAGGQSDEVSKSDAIVLPKTPAPMNPLAVRLNVPCAVVEVMVAGWLHGGKPDIYSTQVAVVSMKRLLNIDSTVTRQKLTEAAEFWQEIEDETIQEAMRLEELQKALKAKDPKGTSLTLKQLGVPDTSELDDEIAKLPIGMINTVEVIGDHEVEMTFPLDSVSQLQRGAMGIPSGASTLVLQLFLDRNNRSPPTFCLHYDTDQHFETMAHTRYDCSTESEQPTKQICTSAQTAFTWQLNRLIYSQLRQGAVGIRELHNQITTWLPSLSQLCISCSYSHASQSIQLRRSTPCDADLYSCARLWYNLPLHIRIPEIRTDTFALDLALSSVYAAAIANKPELLPDCPIRGFETIKTILNSLPVMRVMRDAVNLSSVLSKYHAQAEKLISWAVVHHRGCLATATGLLKIPNLPPGTHQFVLANASPKLEASFVQKIEWTKRETTVLFHGTALDRLPAILSQGLRVCSGTALQRTGAAHGKGIYLADDPATSFYYSPASLSWKNSGLNNMRMLLGCEVVGGGHKVTGNIHVITDAESVMVRYILLFTKEAKMPIRGHVESAMVSGMKALRSGAM